MIRSYRVIRSDQFFTGQEAQKEKIDKRLDQSELSVLNSPGRSVQLEHNVHKQPGNMPNLQAEHLSEHSEAFQGFTNSDSLNVKAYEFPKRTQLPHSGYLPPGISHTGNPLDIGHTGNRSDQEHGSVRTRHHSDVSRSSRRDSNTRRNTIPLQHAEPGEHSPALMIRHRPARNRSRIYDSVSPRRYSHSTSRSRGKKKSLIRRGNILPLLVLFRAALSLLPLVKVKEKENGTSLKRRRNTLNHIHPSVIRVKRSTRGRGVLLLLLPLRQFLQILLLLLGEVQPGRSLE